MTEGFREKGHIEAALSSGGRLEVGFGLSTYRPAAASGYLGTLGRRYLVLAHSDEKKTRQRYKKLLEHPNGEDMPSFGAARFPTRDLKP